MKTTSRTSSKTAFRWTQRLAVSASCLAVIGCGGGDGSPAPEAMASAPTQLLATMTMSGSSAAVSSPGRYNRLVYQLYLAYYGRPPDPASLDQYATQLSTLGLEPNLSVLMSDYQKNPKVRALVDAFAGSAESKSMYSGSTEQFVIQLFRTVLGRAPDNEGKGFWVSLINSGKLTRATAALALMSGAVNATDAAAINNKLDASAMFTNAVQAKQLSSAYLTSEAIIAARSLLSGVTASTDEATVSASVASSIMLLAPPPRGSSLSTIAPDAVTEARVSNLSSVAQTNVPFTFGQPFIAGDLGADEHLLGRLDNGSTIPLQIDVKATHADGSVRHAVISGVLPSLAAGATSTIDLLKGTPPSAPSGAVTSVPANFNSRVEIVLDGIQYKADLADAMKANNVIRWLAGPITSESIATTPFKSSNGTVHPHLSARFAVRNYGALNNQVRVDVTVENNWAFAAAPRNFRYDVRVLVGERVAYSQKALPHYHHARWHKVVWSGEAPPVHVKHHSAYIIATKAVPNYDLSVIPSEATLASIGSNLTADKLGPMKVGLLNPYMPTTGGRPDIGPLPVWAVTYLLSMDVRAWRSMMAVADGSGSWSIHYRDDNTGYPIRLDNPVNKTISTHMNLANKGPLPVPRCADNNKSLCWTPYTPDTAHQPSMAYLPYLLTGDYFYLEELQFWAAWNPIETDPGFQGNGLGLVRWQQLRGQAWSLRTLGQAAYVTPNEHYMKDYFTTMVKNNLDFYHNSYVVKNPNALGVYDGSGANAFQVGQSAPWQDDFFTWSFGYLSELGFTKAEPILQWKAKYSVGRMTAPGFCFVEGAAYFLKFRKSSTAPIYDSFAQLYSANFTNSTVIDDASHIMTHPLGLSYLDLPCGGASQAEWRTAASKTTWLPGQMTGYASSNTGYPANMQIALAVAANSGIPNAQQAWSTFMSRSVKPDYSKGPQFAIVPR